MTDGAIATIVTGLITVTTMVIGFLTMWIKLKYGADQAQEAKEKAAAVEKKIDDNTKITKDGMKEATNHAVIAALAATKAEQKTDDLAIQLNGKLEAKIREIVKDQVAPIMVMFKSHSESDDKNMTEIRTALGELRDKTRPK